MAKTAKSTKKFINSGQLKKTIDARRKHQQVKKKMASRRGNKGQKGPARAERDDEDEEVIPAVTASKGKGKAPAKGKMSVDELLGAGFMDDSDADSGDEDGAEDDDESDDGEDEEEFADDASFASVDALDDEGENHLMELSKLAEKDPEFYKFLQENDKELLDFNPDREADDEDEEYEEDAMQSDQLPDLKSKTIVKWQKAILEQRSLRALRKLLIAYRSAVYMHADGQVLAWRIDSADVYNKLITTALKYTPVVLAHHIPYKTQSNGKIKPPTQTAKFKTLQKLILSFFHNTIHLISQLTDSETLQLALDESAKIIPYIFSSRKTVKTYLKTCLEQWSSGQDPVRIAAFLALRRLASVANDTTLDSVLKSTYLTLVRSSKLTGAHTLPSINLMKNSASELFCLDQATAYQHAFGYIRQLAIHLRNSMKIKSKDAYKQVYNWQYVHSLDFWALVIARACDANTEAETRLISPLKPLIYPLVQVSLGAIKLISNSRSYPFHLHVIRSLLHLTRHTNTYISIAPYILPIISSPLSSSGKPKASTLRPFDFDVQIRAPQQYLKTRVYSEGLVEESTYLLAQWLASKPVQGSIAFPEIIIPVIVALRKTVKVVKSGSGNMGKEVGLVKTVIERAEDSARWVEQRRKAQVLAPSKIKEVAEWERETQAKVDESPLAKYLKVQTKVREKKKSMVEKARVGVAEMLSE